MPKTINRYQRRHPEKKESASRVLARLLAERATLSIEEAANILGIGRNTAYDMVKKGSLPSLLIGLRRRVVPVAALLKMLEGI